MSAPIAIIPRIGEKLLAFARADTPGNEPPSGHYGPIPITADFITTKSEFYAANVASNLEMFKNVFVLGRLFCVTTSVGNLVCKFLCQ